MRFTHLNNGLNGILTAKDIMHKITSGYGF